MNAFRKHVLPLAAAALVGGGFVPGIAAAEPPGTDSRAAEEVQVVVDHGYTPSRLTVPEGRPIRLTFIRREYGACTREVVFPSLGLRRELPPNKPVTIELPPQKAGEIAFECGMKMNRGTLVVEPSRAR